MASPVDRNPEALEEAVAKQPWSFESQMQLGMSRMGEFRYRDAERCFREAIRLKPDLAPLHYNLAQALERMGRSDEALHEFKQAVSLGPGDTPPLIGLGFLLLARGDSIGALQCAHRVIAISLSDPIGHLVAAKALHALGREEEMEVEARAVISLAPDIEEPHTMLGLRSLTKGNFGEAEAFFQRSIELLPDHPIALFGLTQCRTISPSDKWLLDRMEDLIARTGYRAKGVAYLHYGLGKARQDLSEFEQAMRHFDSANEILFDLQPIEERYDKKSSGTETNLTVRSFTAERLEEARPVGLESELPIFIVGMVRSGTTLVEQILSSHSEVGAAGELDFWPTHAKDGRLDEDPSRLPQLARDYIKELRKEAPSVKRVTDKMPMNYRNLGVIRLALPKARIVHVRRDPVDTCLSIYTTPNLAVEFAHRRSDIVAAYREYLKLMAHWRRVLPSDRFMEVQYEELVHDPEPVIRTLLEFCGLEWDEACLRHESNAKAVRTPSLWQVRQPIYATSVERWRRYEPWLGEFRELISDTGGR